jgi:D-glycero-alpha-D-manno-heptose-7-phosphate kinase
MAWNKTFCPMTDKIQRILEKQPIEASAPCRIDMGGTLDIRTFYYPLRQLSPCTFNIAVGLRTRVRLLPHHHERIKISSRGFESAEFPTDQAPFVHPLGLMFAIAAYFNARNIHIQIESPSPPRSALGGSSAAAVALIAACSKLMELADSSKPLSRSQIAVLAHGLEESVAGVPCGIQDQLAAAYGGVNAWMWPTSIQSPQFRRKAVLQKRFYKDFEQHLLVALMNRETAIRQKMTPDVLDEIGIQLTQAAVARHCGARFTGAGGGGCIWALGEVKHIDSLRVIWEEILSSENEAFLLDPKIDSRGLVVHSP